MCRIAFRAKGGFTLIEILVVTSILALVIGVIVACLASGIRVWQTARNLTGMGGPALIDVAIFERDLSRAIPFYGIPFSGEGTKVSFAAIIDPSGAVSNGESAMSGAIGTIQYSYDRNRRALQRKQWPYPRPEPPDSTAEELTGGVEGWILQYCAWPDANRLKGAAPDPNLTWDYVWSNPTNIPGAIRLEISLMRGASVDEITKTMFLPEKFFDANPRE